MLLCLQMCWQMILILRYFFFFLNPLKTGISHTTSPHSQHHPADTLARDITCFEEKKVKRAKVNKKGTGKKMAECRWRAVGRLGGGGGHSLPKQLWISQSQWRRTLAGAFLPFIRKKEWKARRASAYESCRNKHKAVSRAVTDMWRVSSSSSADVQCERICLRAYVEVCQINRLKGETVGGTGQDFGLRVRAQLFFYFFFFCVWQSDWEWGQRWRASSVFAYMSVEVSFFILRLWARLEAATGSNTGWLVFWLSAE